MRKFPLTIVSPDGAIFNGEAESVLVRTRAGDVEILAGHTDYLAVLEVGRVRVTADGVSRSAAANGGFLSVRGGRVKLLTTTFEFADQIDIHRARQSLQRGEEALRNAKDAQEIALAKARICRALCRIGVAGG